MSGAVDPVSDIEIINTELALADMETVERALQKAEKQTRSGDKSMLARVELLNRIMRGLDEKGNARHLHLDKGLNLKIAHLDWIGSMILEL